MKDPMRTLVADVEDKPGVLNRVTSLFRRRAYNIESLGVARTDQAGISRMTVVLSVDDDTMRRLVASLYKLVNVLKIEEFGAGVVVRDLALVKVGVGVGALAEGRAQVLQLCETFRARVISVAPETVIIEITGPGDKIDGFIEVLRPFGIQEMVRTGAIAMTRGYVPYDPMTTIPS